jgi:acyl-coenzyme A synthetase/AMP-(fatty) acid ligase
VLLRHPAIGEIAVVGLPHDGWGEEVVAFVVTNPGAAVSPDARLVRECDDLRRARLRQKRSFPGLMMWPRQVRRSSRAIAIFGPSDTVVHPPKLSFVVMMTLARS